MASSTLIPILVLEKTTAQPAAFIFVICTLLQAGNRLVPSPCGPAPSKCRQAISPLVLVVVVTVASTGNPPILGRAFGSLASEDGTFGFVPKNRAFASSPPDWTGHRPWTVDLLSGYFAVFPLHMHLHDLRSVMGNSSTNSPFATTCTHVQLPQMQVLS